MPGLSATALAEKLGVTRQMVYQYVHEGKIKRDDTGAFDLAEVRRQLAHTLGRKRGGSPRSGIPWTAGTPPIESSRAGVSEAEPQHAIDKGEPDPNSLAEAQRRKEWAQARRAELDVLEREGKLVDAADVLRTWERHIDAVKNRLLLASSKFGACCRPIAEREYRAALEDLANYDTKAE